MKVWIFLKGKKTYIVSAISIAVAVWQYSQGQMDQAQLVQVVAGMLGFSTVRHGISTTGVISPALAVSKPVTVVDPGPVTKE
jgi:hypothetical protein